MNHSRHLGIYNCGDLEITIVGCGGIGASAAVCLAKMGVRRLSLYDGDRVAEENMATQLHTIASLGSSKVEAVAQLINQFSDECTIGTTPRNIGPTGFGLSSQIVISAVDSIQARKDIWAAVRKQRVEWYMDARMGAEVFHLYCLDMQNTDWGWYERMLAGQSDETVLEAPCTMKATMFTAFISAGIIGKTIRQIATGIRPECRLVYDILSDHISYF